jgi:hypothetical protein
MGKEIRRIPQAIGGVVGGIWFRCTRLAERVQKRKGRDRFAGMRHPCERCRGAGSLTRHATTTGFIVAHRDPGDRSTVVVPGRVLVGPMVLPEAEKPGDEIRTG